MNSLIPMKISGTPQSFLNFGQPPNADNECGDERAVRRRVLLHQALQGFRHPMDGMGWQYLKSIRQLLVGNEDSALRDAFEKCTHPCMRWHPTSYPKVLQSPRQRSRSSLLASCI